MNNTRHTTRQYKERRAVVTGRDIDSIEDYTERRISITCPSVFVMAFENAMTGGWIPRIEIDGLNEEDQNYCHLECDILGEREYEYFFEALDAGLGAAILLGYQIHENVGIDKFLPEHKDNPDKCREWITMSVDDFIENFDFLVEIVNGEKLLN